MSRINLNNYEAFWLDYLEGNLSTEDTAELMLFISQHPGLDIDLELTLPSLESDPLHLSEESKNQLKDLAELETLVVLEMDNELSQADKSRLHELAGASNETYDHLKQGYNSTRLKVETVFYDQKNELKQTLVIPILARYAAAAAVVLLIVSIIPWNKPLNFPTEHASSEQNSKINGITGISKWTYPTPKSFDFDSKINREDKDLSADHIFYAEDKAPALQDTAKLNKPPLNSMKEDEPPLVAVHSDATHQNPTPTVSSVDSSKTVTPDKHGDIAVVTAPSPKNEASTEQTLPVFLAEKVLKVEKQEDEPLLATIIDQKTNIDLNYETLDKDDKKVTSFKIGKFEYYKSSKK